MQHAVQTTDAVRDQVRAYLCDSFLTQDQCRGLKDDEDLLMVLDSLQLLRMVIELEAQYSIQIENNELTKENLGTIDHIATFILWKTS